MKTCATPAQLGALARGELPEEEAAAIRAHAQSCVDCYAELLRGGENDTVGTPLPEDSPGWAQGIELDWQPGRDLGRYVILLTLGKGGMGVVFRAYDKDLDRAVALKVLHHGDDDAGRSRLLREAQAMARLSNANVVAVHDVVVLEGRVCVVMELVEGETVREWLKHEPKRSWREILSVFRAAAEGLAAAHDAKLVHRDFKPDNVLVARDGRVRVTDFGIAFLARDEQDPAAAPSAAGQVGPAKLAVEPRPAAPDVTLASVGGPNATSASVPSANVPSANVPSANVPSANVPSANVPSANVPSANATSANATSANATSAKVPDASATSARVPTGALPNPTLIGTPGATMSVALRTLVGSHTLSESITQEGRIVGTPRYMAPEQFAKGTPDFRTDQFSFAIALYEALYGRHPFAGETTAERIANVQRGEVQPAPASSSVPQWVHRTLARALSVNPAGRFPSMRELNLALGRDPSRRRNSVLVAAGVGAAVVLAAVAVVRAGRVRAELCTGSERKLAGVWDEARREKIHAVFVATGVPFAEDSFTRAATVLDGYTSQWVATHKEACEATSIRGEQSPQVLTLRMACLQERLDAVAALAELFTRADPGLVGKAKQSLDALPRLASCSDVARLTAKLPPPDDAAAAAEVERIRKELTRARVLMEAGRYGEADPIVQPALAAAERIAYSPLRAEAEVAAGSVLSGQANFKGAIPLQQSAFTRALGDGYDELLTMSAVRLAGATTRLQQNERALEWASLAEAANRRAKDPEMSVLIENARGNIARNVGDFATAARHYEEGASVARAKLGPEHMTTLGLSYNHASTLQNLGRFREASVEFVSVIATARRVLGPKHPFLSFPLIGSANVASNRGQLEQARPFYEEVVALTGGKGLNADNAFDGLGDIALKQGRYDDAYRFFQRQHEVDEAFSPGGAESLVGIAKQGLVLLRQGHPEKAWTVFEDVLARGSKVEGAFDVLAIARMGEAELLRGRGKLAQALALAEAARDSRVKTRGKSHPETLEARLLAAELRSALGQKDRALTEGTQILADARVELDEAHPLVRRAGALIAEAGGRAATLAP